MWRNSKKISENILFSDIKTLDTRHSGKYISNIMFDSLSSAAVSWCWCAQPNER